MTPKQLASEVENLFSLPELYFKIKKVIDHPASTVNDVADVVVQDPNISARILRIVNSSFFGFATEIESIPRAINIMGMSQLHDLALTISATKAFKGINSSLINMKDFWLHSIYCAAIAKLIARKCNVVDSERLFVSGILHDIGHLVIYTKLPSQTAKLLETAKQQQVPLAQLEKSTFGFDYAEVGGELLKLWKLPDCLSQTVYHHTQIQNEEQFALDAAIIHIANILVLQEESEKTGLKAPNFDPLSFQLTSLSEEDLTPLKLEAKKNMADILKLLFSQ
jgi:HD-like signal output (HDOD) protein